jgi:DNA polymerase V
MVNHGGQRKGAGRPKGQGQYGEPTTPIRLPISLISSVQAFVKNKCYQIPFYHSTVAAGFPSPAEDSIDCHLDLNEHLIKHPSATFFVRVSGHSMRDAGIHEGDILIVDRSLIPSNGKIVVAAIDGQLTVKRLHKMPDGELSLIPENPVFSPIIIKEGNEVLIWGVVTNVIHSV